MIPQPVVALLINFVTMLSSIYLYHNSFFQADKVYNIAPDWLLPTEFVTLKLPEA